MQNETNEKLVYTVDEASKMLSCSRNLLYRICRENKIQGVIFLGPRKIVISVAAIHRLLEGKGKEPMAQATDHTEGPRPK